MTSKASLTLSYCLTCDMDTRHMDHCCISAVGWDLYLKSSGIFLVGMATHTRAMKLRALSISVNSPSQQKCYYPATSMRGTYSVCHHRMGNFLEFFAIFALGTHTAKNVICKIIIATLCACVTHQLSAQHLRKFMNYFTNTLQ